MTTVLQIVNGAAEEIEVKTAEAALESADFEFILDRLNDLGTEWADIGLTPAFVEVSDSTDTVNIDRSAVRAFKLNLAISIAASFQKNVTQSLAVTAEDSLNRLRSSTINLSGVAYPDTLPLGSGNDCPDSYRRDRFFPSNPEKNF